MAKVSKKNMTTAEKIEYIKQDPILFNANFIKIPDEQSALIPFEMNEAQQDFVRNKERFSIICKTRQLGISTSVLGIFLWSAHLMPNSNYIIVADKSDSTQNLFNRLKIMYESIPDNIRIGQKRSNKYELLLENNSRITVQTAGTKEIGRSFNFQGILLSEFALYTNEQQEKSIVSLENALAKNADAFMVLESTSNGVGNLFYEIYKAAEKGHSNYKAFFFGWASKTHRQMHKFEIDEAVRKYKAENHGNMMLANSGDMYPDELEIYNNYDVTVAQIIWRKYKMSTIGEDKFNQEQPLTAEHSFIQSDTGFFSAVDITERYKYLIKPLAIKELSKELPESLSKFYGNGLYIYEDIDRNEIYKGGIDTSAGLKQDFSSVNILDSVGRQVAVFYRNDLPVYKFAKVAYDLGHYYNYCMYAIERNSYGLSLIDKLRRELGYIQVMRFNKFDKIKGVMTSEYGFYTDNVSKVKLMNDMKESFETGIILINDKETLDQMKIYVQSGNGSLGNIKGKKNFDDVVDATALSVQAFKANISYL